MAQSVKGIQAYIYSPVEQKVVDTFDISFKETLAEFGPQTSWGSNSPVQYNPKTKAIVFVTEGASLYDGSCLNPDGTCEDRLYQYKTDNKSINLITRLDNLTDHWVIDPNANAVVYAEVDGTKQHFNKVDLSSGKITQLSNQSLAANTGVADLSISSDGTKVFQTSKTSINGWFEETVSLNALNLSTNRITSTQTYQGPAIEYETNVSGDGSRISFISDPPGENATVMYFDHSQNKANEVYRGKVSNVGTVISSDGTKITYYANGIYFFDVNTKATTHVPSTDSGNYALGWSPTSRYLLFDSKTPGLKIYDSQLNTVSELNFGSQSSFDILSVQWLTE